MQQTISVAVIGGKMTIAPSNLTLTLNREGGSDRYKAALPAIQVVDARGTLAGWTAALDATDLPSPATLSVKPGRAVAVYGNQIEVHAAHQTKASGTQAALMFADRDGGGGTFEIDGTVVVTVPHAHAPQITLHIDVTVA